MSYEFLVMTQNIAFSVALLVVICFALIEGVGLIFGAGLSDLISSILPDVNVGIESPDFTDNNTLTVILAWLRVGKVPIIILLIVFLTNFAISGLIIQLFISTITGYLLPALIASAIALIFALPPTRFFGGLLERYLPKDETYAVSNTSFIGREATIVLGNASFNHPAEARLKDEYGKTHYIMLEPDDENATVKQGEHLLIVRQVEARFYGIVT